MAEDNKPNPEQQQQQAAATKAPKTVKVGDTVHLVTHGPRFVRQHVDAEVKKVHQKGKFVDLIAHDDDPKKSITIDAAPFDETGLQPDSWHFPETAA